MLLSVENLPRELLVKVAIGAPPFPTEGGFPVESQAFIRVFCFSLSLTVTGIGGGVPEGHGCQRYQSHQPGAEFAHGPI